MIIRHTKSSALRACLLVLVIIVCIVSSVSGVAVMSVDLGTEWMKVAVVSVSIVNEATRYYLKQIVRLAIRNSSYLICGLINILVISAWSTNGDCSK